MFTFSTIKSKLIKQLYSINLRRLPIQHGEVSVMVQTVIVAIIGENLQFTIFDLFQHVNGYISGLENLTSAQNEFVAVRCYDIFAINQIII